MQPQSKNYQKSLFTIFTVNHFSGTNSSLYNTSNAGNTPTQQTGTGAHQRSGSSTTAERGSSKHEQTEPMDFSSGQSFGNFGSTSALAGGKGSFDGSTFGRSTSPSSELGRFRSSAGKKKMTSLNFRILK